MRDPTTSPMSQVYENVPRNEGAAPVVAIVIARTISYELGDWMAASFDRTNLIEAQDRLINLLVQQDEAQRAEDWRRVNALDKQIAAARAHHDAMRPLTAEPRDRA
jgi:hypothetical protein